jgi:hypothetical protein
MEGCEKRRIHRKGLLLVLLAVFVCVFLLMPALHDSAHCADEHCPVCILTHRARGAHILLAAAVFLAGLTVMPAAAGPPRVDHIFLAPVRAHVQMNN